MSKSPRAQVVESETRNQKPIFLNPACTFQKNDVESEESSPFVHTVLFIACEQRAMTVLGFWDELATSGYLTRLNRLMPLSESFHPNGSPREWSE